MISKVSTETMYYHIFMLFFSKPVNPEEETINCFEACHKANGWVFIFYGSWSGQYFQCVFVIYVCNDERMKEFFSDIRSLLKLLWNSRNWKALTELPQELRMLVRIINICHEMDAHPLWEWQTKDLQLIQTQSTKKRQNIPLKVSKVCRKHKSGC